jgi:ribosome maturation factor RimP
MPNAAGEIVERIIPVAERVVGSEGLELVEVEWRGSSKRGVLRIYIDKPEGVTHEDCRTVARSLSTILDVEELAPGAYNLEVSSPGLDRKLLKLPDFERFAGKRARIRLHREVGGKKQITARLRGVEQGRIVVELSSGEEERFAFEDVSLARLVVEV